MIMRRVRQFFLVAWLAAALPPGFGQEFRETDLKAVFLLRFGSFMQWPEPAQPQSEFVIGVLGEDPLAAVLEAAVVGETVAGRPVRVVRYRGVNEVRDPAILFISRSKRDRLRHILHILRGRPILTVSDLEHFTDAGGMVGLASDQRRVRLRVNVTATRASRISVSSKLLSVVEVVGDESSTGGTGA